MATGLEGIAQRWTVRNGVVVAAEIELETFLARSDEIFAAAPQLRSLIAIGLIDIEDWIDKTREGPEALPLLERLFASPAYRRLHGLQICSAKHALHPDRDAVWFTYHGDAIVKLMIERGAFAQLRSFGSLANGLTAAGHALLWPAIAHVERLVLGDAWPFGDLQTIDLADAKLPALVALELAGKTTPRTIAQLPPSLRELMLWSCDADALEALAASPLAGQLERLAIRDQVRDRAVFARFPRLRELHVDELPRRPPQRDPYESRAIRLLEVDDDLNAPWW